MPTNLLAQRQPVNLLKGVQPPAQPPSPQFGGPLEEAEGLGEAALQIGTGMLAEPIAGLQGIKAALIPGGETGVEAISRVREDLTFQPRTDIGKRTSQAIAEPFQVLDDVVTRFAEVAGAGNPIAQTAIKTAILTLPMFFGIKTGVKNKAKVNRAINKVEKEARDMGIDVGSHEIKNQIVEAADSRTLATKSKGVEELQASLQQARDIAKDKLDADFETARGTSASIRASSFEELGLEIRSTLADRDLEMMPIVTKRLNELDAIQELTGNATNTRVKLQEVEKFRRRLNSNRAAVTKKSENASLNIIKAKLDEFLDNQFNQDMIVGDPEALQAWKNARATNTRYKANFNDVKTIRQLVNMEATTEQVRAWVIGASSMGAKKEAALVVKKIKTILGEDHPQFTALRDEFLFDVLEPLIQETPNFKQFLKNYDRTVRDNPTLIKELAPFSKTSIDKLAVIARATEKLGVKGKLKIPVDLSRLGAVAMFGHQIARAAMKVNIARATFDFLRGAGGQKRNMLHELSGYDPNARFMAPNSIAYTAVISEEISDRFGVKESDTVTP